MYSVIKDDWKCDTEIRHRNREIYLPETKQSIIKT